MRRLLLILIALSLSWVTTGYACDMSGALPQPACCCDAGAQHSCPEPTSDCTTGAMNGAPSEGCCFVVASSGAGAQGQAETTPDFPPINISAPQLTKVLPRRTALPQYHVFTRDHSAPRIYLLTGRLRR